MRSPKTCNALFWPTFALNTVCVVLSAWQKNILATFAWLVALLWMLRFYHAAIVLDKAVELTERLTKLSGVDVDLEDDV